MGTVDKKYFERLKELHKYMGLFDFEYLIEIEYSALNSFLIESESTIKNKERSLTKKIKNWETEKKLYENAPEPFERFETEIIEFNQFSSLLNNSFFIMSYSIFERYFFEICNYCQKEEEKKVSAKDLKGNGIDQCRKYIQNVIEINLKSLAAEWAEIKKYQKIRNFIVHNIGILNEKDAKNESLKEFIFNNKYIDYDDYDNKSTQISINSIKFITDFTGLIKGYFSKLFHEIENQKKQ
ncbi:MAG: hypothetical protein KAG64_06890 [Bacteroidales bacterium]|nr:hypothetical protein [Bacteroidales bacterium]